MSIPTAAKTTTLKLIFKPTNNNLQAPDTQANIKANHMQTNIETTTSSYQVPEVQNE